jgi:hypothetical protein
MGLPPVLKQCPTRTGRCQTAFNRRWPCLQSPIESSLGVRQLRDSFLSVTVTLTLSLVVADADADGVITDHPGQHRYNALEQFAGLCQVRWRHEAQGFQRKTSSLWKPSMQEFSAAALASCVDSSSSAITTTTTTTTTFPGDSWVGIRIASASSVGIHEPEGIRGRRDGDLSGIVESYRPRCGAARRKQESLARRTLRANQRTGAVLTSIHCSSGPARLSSPPRWPR